MLWSSLYIGMDASLDLLLFGQRVSESSIAFRGFADGERGVVMKKDGARCVIVREFKA